ncbi:hypothetical protein [Facklamia miroungae]|nr:hypothetical protein [Facklamia miroungae]
MNMKYELKRGKQLITSDEIKSWLWAGANELRGSMDAGYSALY